MLMFLLSHKHIQGLKPLWMRQIPYTMMKFACFEKTVVAIYTYCVPKPRDQCTKVDIKTRSKGSDEAVAYSCTLFLIFRPYGGRRSILKILFLADFSLSVSD